MELTRPLFEDAIEGLLARVRGSVTELLNKAGVSESQVDTVFFTGGSSGIPALRNSVAAMLPNARHVEGNIFGSIGSGLAIGTQALRRRLKAASYKLQAARSGCLHRLAFTCSLQLEASNQLSPLELAFQVRVVDRPRHDAGQPERRLEHEHR